MRWMIASSLSIRFLRFQHKQGPHIISNHMAGIISVSRIVFSGKRYPDSSRRTNDPYSTLFPLRMLPSFRGIFLMEVT
jgi:hypothetical protein